MDPAGTRRRLVVGGSVYPGEVVETSPSATAVLAFRDDSRTTLGSATRFRVDSFVFDEQSPKDGRFLVSLLRGSLRALTGIIGKTNNRNVGFTTATATIGIRGTGLDLDCSDEGRSEESCRFYTWLGSIEVTQKGQSALQVLEAGQGLYVSASSVPHPPCKTCHGRMVWRLIPNNCLALEPSTMGKRACSCLCAMATSR